jgi:hypothetical protein
MTKTDRPHHGAPLSTGFCLGPFLAPAPEREPLTKLHDEIELGGDQVECLTRKDRA